MANTLQAGASGRNLAPSLFGRLTIRGKLFINAAVSVVLLVVFSAWLWQTLGDVRSTVENKLANEVNLALAAQDLQRNVVQVQQFLSDVSATQGKDGLDDGFKLAEAQQKQFRDSIKNFRALYEARGDAENVALIKKVSGNFETFYQSGEMMAKSYVSGGPAAGNPMMGEFDAASAELQTSLAVFVKLHVDGVKTDVGSAGQQTQQMRQVALILCLVVVVLTTVVGSLIAMSIVRPMRTATRVAQEIAEGDLTQTIPATGGAADEVSVLLRAMTTMQANLRTTVAQVQQQVEEVSSVSSQLAAANQDLSARTEEQSSALQQTAVSMDELGSAVQNNADNASSANTLAASASQVASSCGDMVGQVVSMMQELNASSRRINDIVGVIDGIAFQTNILALNAAVEAARAGEQGRGFAVVATEVRALAGRSSEAAKQIKQLIADSVGRVESGTHLVGRAGTTMSEVVTSIQRVTHIVGEISTATAEQSSSVGQVGQAVSQMDQATQQNAALVEETARAADGLYQQSRELLQAIAAFKLPGQTGPTLALTA